MLIDSVFDGCSMAMQALKNLNIRPERYRASEIDKYCIQVSEKNFKDIKRVGDIKNFHPGSCKDSILIGGSPCQNLSIAGNRKGLSGEKSSLFFEYLRVLEEGKYKYFILENVASMRKTDRDKISKYLGVEPVMIDAALVSAQSRKRLFWANFLISQP